MDLSVDANETVRAVIGPLTKSFPETLLGLTFDLIYFVRCLLCKGPIKYQIGFLKLWKFIYKTIYKYFVVNI